MKLINTSIGLRLLTLILLLGFLRKSSSTRLPFSLPEININVPKPIGDLFGNIPGLSSFLKTNTHHGASQETLHHSFGPVSLNVNIQQQDQRQQDQQQQHHQHQHQPPYQFTAENYQYLPPNTNQQNGYYGYPQSYYYPPPPGYYGQGYYPVGMPPPPPPSAPQYSLTQPNWNQYPSQPAFNQPNPYNKPVNPSADQDPHMFSYQTTKMPPLAPIEDPNKPALRAPSPYKEIPRAVITPDSLLYVHIPEEPTIYGIEPRR